MAQVINMPRLSDTMEEGTVATWLKQVGDAVSEGDILAEIETDKATMEFESFYEGTLLHIGIQEGETAQVDKLLAIIGEEGEDISGLLNGETPAETEETPKEEVPASDTSVDDTPAAATAIPEGVVVITMPRLSDTMEEGTVATWLKGVGDEISEGDILAEIETDKATMEFESFNEGTLLHIGLEEGATAKVDELLAVIGPKGTDVSGVVANYKVGSNAAPEAPKKEEAPKAVAPKPTPAKEAPKPVAKPTSSATSNGGRIFASPLAKKIAEEKGINLAQVQGSGENGRIVKADVENFTPSAASSGANVAQFVATGEESSEEVPNSQMRKAIARSLGNSKFSAPHYYLNVEFNICLLYTSPSPRDQRGSRMPSSA